jgi:hypothetical protein
MSTFGPKLAAALVKAQSLVEGAKKGKRNDHFRSSYADLASVWEACGSALTESGIYVGQFPTTDTPGTVSLRTVLLHESGESVESTLHMPVKDSGNPQAVGSAITYARRYALMAALGICPEDDDGNAASKQGRLEQPVPALSGEAAAKLVKGVTDKIIKALDNKDMETVRQIYTSIKTLPLAQAARQELLNETGKLISATNTNKEPS